MEKYFIIMSVVIILLLLPGVNLSFADGFIIPIPPPGIKRVPPLAIKYHRVSVEISDQVAHTKIDQVFINEFHQDLEGTYIFPLPKGANISEFAMYINGERISGELLEKEKARKIYQDIVNRMKDPALLEYLDRDMFKIRVYPIPAHGEKRIQLEYSEILKNDAGLVRYHYPLDTERFSSRPLKDVSISIKLRTQQALKSVYSPSHDVEIDRKGDHQAIVGFEETNVVPDKDFILYYSLSQKTVGVNLLTYKKSRSDGYFMLMLSPGYEVEAHQVLPKDIIFVLDTSGSMRRDGKLKQAQDALIYGLEGLNPDDRFGLVTFSTTVKVFDDALQKGTKQSIQDAVGFVEDLRARGGTDIYEALRAALGLFEESEILNRPKMIVFLTDGRPTVGMTEYKDILKKIHKKNAERNRIFAFGVGYDVNTHLLDALAEESKAASAYIEPQEDLEVLVSTFFDKIDSPVLSELDLDISEAKVYDVFPKELPDLFKGSQLLVFGRYRNSGDYELVLSGLTDDRKQLFEYDVEFPRSALTHDFLPRIWASRKIGYLLDQIRLHGEEPELKEEVIELAKKFGIVTPYTSYLVVEDEEIPFSGERRARDLLNTTSNAPQAEPTAPGVGRGLYRLERESDIALPDEFSKLKEGEMAVRMSKDVNRLKQQEIVTESVSSEVRYMGTKTFYLIDGVWIDSEYQEGQETVNIAYGSDAYFKLLDTIPELGKYLSLGEQVIVCWEEDTCLKIGKDGISKADSQELQDIF